MGRLHDENIRVENGASEYVIRVPIRTVQLTERDGKTYPLAFYWQNDDGEEVEVCVEQVLSVVRLSEQKSGTVGDRYECKIDGLTEYLYFGLLQPRKWFRLKPVTREEYEAYYRLPGEIGGSICT